MYLVEGVEDGKTASVLGGADKVLVFKAGVSKCLEFSLLPRFGIFGDHWIVSVKGSIVLIEQCHYPWSIFVGRIGEDETDDFACF